MKTRLFALVLACTLLLSVVGVSTAFAEEESITLRIAWWGSQARHDYTQKVLDLYTELNPHITFEASPSSWDGYFEKLSTQAAGGTMPDIMQMDYLYITTYANNGTLADLTPYIDGGVLDTTNIDDNLAKSGNINGVIAGIPLSTSILTYGYNPEVLAEAGLEPPTPAWTWEEFVEICNTVHEKTGKYGMATHYRDINGLLYWVRQYGYDLFNEDGTALAFDDESIFAAYCDLWKSLVDSGAMPNPDEYAQIMSLDLSAQPVPMGQAAFATNWSNYTSIVAPTNTNIGMVTPPMREGGELGLWVKPGMFFSVAESSQHQEEAVKFVNWFINSEEANDIIMAERGAPSSGAVREYLKDKLNDQQAQMFEYIDMAVEYCGKTPAPDAQGTSEIIDLMVQLVDQVLYGQITSEEAAANFHSEANAILARNAG